MLPMLSRGRFDLSPPFWQGSSVSGSRRDFLRASAVLGGALGIGLLSVSSSPLYPYTPLTIPQAPMRPPRCC